MLRLDKQHPGDQSKRLQAAMLGGISDETLTRRTRPLGIDPNGQMVGGIARGAPHYLGI